MMKIGQPTQIAIDNLETFIEQGNERAEELDTSIASLNAEFLSIGEEADRTIGSLNSTIGQILATDPTQESPAVRISKDEPARAGIEFQKVSSIDAVKLLVGLGVIWFILKKKKGK